MDDLWVMLNIPFSRLLVSISSIIDTRFTYSLNLCLHIYIFTYLHQQHLTISKLNGAQETMNT